MLAAVAKRPTLCPLAPICSPGVFCRCSARRFDTMKSSLNLALIAITATGAVALATSAVLSQSEESPDQIPAEIAARLAAAAGKADDKPPKDDFPKWDDVAKDFSKV